MKNFPFLRSIAGALIPCLLLLSMGCSSGKTLTALDNSDKGRAIIVCTTDSLFYRFPAHEWSVGANGDVAGRAREYSSLEAAEKGDDAIGPDVTISAARVASFYEPGGLTKIGGVSVIVIALITLGVLILVGSMLPNPNRD